MRSDPGANKDATPCVCPVRPRSPASCCCRWCCPAAAAEPARAHAARVAGSKAERAPSAATTAARRTPPRHAARRDGFAPGRVLVRFEAGMGERGRAAAAAAVDGTVMAGAARPGVASAEPDWLRRVDDCEPGVC
jgi:hypothetical protein